MAIIFQLLITGLAIGSIYAFVALGISFVYRAANVVNFAHGDFAMIAAFIVSILMVNFNLSYWTCFFIAIIAMAILGILFELGIYYPLRNRSFLAVIISTIGASIFFQNSALYSFGAIPRKMKAPFDVSVTEILGARIDPQYLLIIGITVLLMIVQYFLFEKTLLGKKLQACAQDKETALLLGVSVNLMIAITFAYSTILGGIAGVLVGPIFFVTTGMGFSIGLKAFLACIVGGFGSVPGAIIGGVCLGLIETFSAAFISSAYKEGFSFAVLIIVLLVRPRGIFGEKVSEKA